MRKLARELGRRTEEVALRWVLAQSGMSCVLAGASSRQQLEANAPAVSEALRGEVLQRLGEVTEGL